ncbi:MAG: helix-turn-helix transcriptional regulator [Atribacterota bacterium]|nr:helix-turn-helix transcriptional regulator [Atribacterota bacterium]MDD4895535.1 helix-turn-helix transcriptional regulator [Atribacterota bacterium]MDD5637168.1 helix-turn-helix transcriptional regulator [Atribacterota bacterium]
MISEIKKIHPLIRSLIPIIKTIAETFGKNCEVVLHDFSGPQNSIIAIENGYVTGRKIGDPITDLALSSWRQGGFGNKREDKMINYKSKTKDGRILKSSSVFIKDQNNKIVGCLCINYDLTGHMMFEKIMDEFCAINELNGGKEETFTKDVDEILSSIIDEAINEIHKPISLMQKEDNLRVVEKVDEKGGFLIKGAVDQLAFKLNVSRYTVYNYLEEIKARKKNQEQG